MNNATMYAAKAFAVLTSATAAMILFTAQAAFAQVNPPYEIVLSGEGENPPVLEITINFENGNSVLHTVQGNGTTQYGNPGNGDISSISFQGRTISKGEEVVVQIGETPVCYRIFWWWFDSGYYRMSFRREVMWS